MRTSSPALFLLGVLACAGRGDAARDSTSTPAAAPAASASTPTPPVVGHDLKQLQWIAGDWRGTGETQAPFYERYRLADDSTLVVDSFADSTRATVSETTRFELRGGALTSVPGGSSAPGDKAARWYGSVLAGDSVRFEPLANARNSFVWRRSGADEWIAELSWPAANDRPARQVTYTMRRVK